MVNRARRHHGERTTYLANWSHLDRALKVDLKLKVLEVITLAHGELAAEENLFEALMLGRNVAELLLPLVDL